MFDQVRVCVCVYLELEVLMLYDCVRLVIHVCNCVAVCMPVRS